MERVGIVAAAQTPFQADRRDVSIGELIWEVVEQIIQETGLKFEAQVTNSDEPHISKIISCSEDFWQGRTISDMFCHLEMGALNMSLTKVAADGAFAVYHGVINLLSGKDDVVLVVAHKKESETVRSVIENAALDPIYLRPLGMDFLNVAAMQANCYMQKYGISEQQCASVVVKNRRNAFRNPFAQEPLELTVGDVLDSEMLSSPIRALDCKPVSDGACALVLAREEKARSLVDRPVWITGMGNCYDTHYPGDRDLAACESLRYAAQRAYGLAGIDDPRKQIDLAEISEAYSFEELLWMEGLGLCDRGEAGSMLDDGVTSLDGALPVNPSGGVLSGNPDGVAGLARVAEAFLQLQGQAGARQVPGARTALAHGRYGPAGQSHCVITISTTRED